MNEKATVFITIPAERFREMEETIIKLKDWLCRQEKQDDGLLTVAQTMSMFGCSRATLNNWKKKKILIPKVIEGRVYYLKADCLKALHGPPDQMKGGKRNG